MKDRNHKQAVTLRTLFWIIIAFISILFSGCDWIMCKLVGTPGTFVGCTEYHFRISKNELLKKLDSVKKQNDFTTKYDKVKFENIHKNDSVYYIHINCNDKDSSVFKLRVFGDDPSTTDENSELWLIGYSKNYKKYNGSTEYFGDHKILKRRRLERIFKKHVLNNLGLDYVKRKDNC